MVAWGEEKRPPESGKKNGKQQQQQQQSRRKQSKPPSAEHQPLADDIREVYSSPSAVSNGHGVNIKGSNSAAVSAQRTVADCTNGGCDVMETPSQRVKELRERRMSRRRESSLRIKVKCYPRLGRPRRTGRTFFPSQQQKVLPNRRVEHEFSR